MKIKSIIRGFTLIELLVVITIIGILATGAVSVYTSQIQKSRDSVRLTDIKAVQGGIEQFYQDIGEYPDTTVLATDPKSFSGVTIYVPNLPTDPKSGQSRVGAAFDYFYNVSADGNTIPRQEYEISTTFEQQGNIDKKAATDGGNDANRLEFGINLTDTQQETKVTGTVSSTLNKYVCLPVGGGTTAGTCGAAVPMLIRK